MEEIHAHKKMLAWSSPVFAAMLFTSGMRESQEMAIELPDVECSVMRQALQFVHTGGVEEFDRTPDSSLMATRACKVCLHVYDRGVTI